MDICEIIKQRFQPEFEIILVKIEFGEVKVGVIYKGFSLKAYVDYWKTIQMNKAGQLEVFCDELKAEFFEAYEAEKEKLKPAHQENIC